MVRLITDENFSGNILDGLLRKQPDLDLVRIQDVGLQEADDPTLLEWAATENRILLTHDRKTIPDFAYERVRAGVAMPGVFIVNDHLPIGSAIEELLLLINCGLEGEWENRVIFLPLS
jgi:predicted nuclease of predicted toxin-antitoxin system